MFTYANEQQTENCSQLPESLKSKLETYILEQTKSKKKSKKKKKKRRKESSEEEEDEHQVGNLEDVLNQNELEDFSESVKKYKTEKEASRKWDKPKANEKSSKYGNQSNALMKEEAKEDDLLGFSDFSNPNHQKGNNEVNFLDSLNITTPRTVTDDIFAWSNEWSNDEQIKQPKSESLDDFWSNVPANEANNGFNPANANNHQTNLNGGKARVLKKHAATTNNKDPFMDLLSFD